ncbi:MAG: hypothetical protein HN741_04400, partial [Anaerolineae bacterium]|nr:hypothetical protein [Anaerolineae bacterium]
MAKKFIIIIFLLLLIISPRVIAGLNNEKIAQQAAHSGEFEKAAAEYEMAALRLFWRGDLWSELGSAKLLSGQKEDALIAFRIAKEKGALSAFGWDFLGLENWQKGNLEMALIIWREGLVFHPDFAKFYSRLAVAYREKGDYASEKDALIRWLRLEDGTEKKAPYHYRLGLLFFLDSPEKALGELSSALRADSEFAPVVDTLRTSLNLALLESDPALSNILLGRGLALAEEWELAAEIFTRVTQDYPTNASAWAWLG